MANRLRRAFEPGHKPKFLAIVDESPECGRAVRFAARRVFRTQARLLLLSVVDKSDFQHWLGIADRMLEEAQARAKQTMDAHVAACAEIGVENVEHLIVVGMKVEQIAAQIAADLDIAYLVLASGAGAEGPGPLVSMVAGRTPFQIPVVVVPGHLDDAEIDALAG